MIRVRDLVFDYPTRRALHGLSFEIAAGTITALVGPNGAGKTTLLRCLAGLETPFSGEVVLDGLDVAAHRRLVHRRLGFLQDFFGLYDELTVRQCLLYHAAAHGVPAPERPARLDDAAVRLNLDDRLDQKAGTLSRGLRQRLAIAQALIHRPKVLLLDEPASGLDPDARADLSRLLRDLGAQGMTLIVSSHILAELQDYSTHMLILSEGRVVEHCPIRGETGRPRRLRVGLVEKDALFLVTETLVPMLNGTPGVEAVVPDCAAASFDFAGDRAAQASLLRALVEAGLPVAAFQEETRSMQDVYSERLTGWRGVP